MTRTLLVDGNNVLSRSAFAAKSSRGGEMSVDGISTSALLIFINLLSKYVRQVQPDHMAVFWDKGHVLRDQIDPRYKAKRVKHVEAPEEAQTPWRQAQEFLTWAGIGHLARQGVEADDLIAYACHVNSSAATSPYGTVSILSGDKDLLQLVDGVTHQIRIGGSGSEHWDTDRVTEEMGVFPDQIPLYMALTGDAGDGVAGVPGIGPKKALKALEEAGWDWEALLESLGPEKASQAIQARRLVDLRYREFAVWGDTRWSVAFSGLTVPKFTPTAPGGITWEPLAGFLDRWQMKSVESRLRDGTLWYQGPDDVPPDTAEQAFAGMDF